MFLKHQLVNLRSIKFYLPKQSKIFFVSAKIKQLTRKILPGNFNSKLPLKSYFVNVSPADLCLVNILSLARCLIPRSPDSAMLQVRGGDDFLRTFLQDNLSG